MLEEKIIENAQNIIILIEHSILTKEEVRKMLRLKPKISNEIEINGIKFEKKED